MTPAPGGPEGVNRAAPAAEDCSPSRARLGRVAEMLREAEVARPLTPRRERSDRDTGAALAPARRRLGSALPAPRRAADDVLTARVAGPRT